MLDLGLTLSSPLELPSDVVGGLLFHHWQRSRRDFAQAVGIVSGRSKSLSDGIIKAHLPLQERQGDDALQQLHQGFGRGGHAGLYHEAEDHA